MIATKIPLNGCKSYISAHCLKPSSTIETLTQIYVTERVVNIVCKIVDFYEDDTMEDW